MIIYYNEEVYIAAHLKVEVSSSSAHEKLCAILRWAINEREGEIARDR